LQLATVGYEHLRRLGLADRSLRICNARGVFDSSIAEWCLADDGQPGAGLARHDPQPGAGSLGAP